MLLESILDNIKYTRQHFLTLIEDCSSEEMNAIPPGFRNNLIWNLGHVIAAQQNLCYVFSGVTPRVDQALIDMYKPFTAPEAPASADHIQLIRKLAADTVGWLIDDYRQNIFKTYAVRHTKYGPVLSTTEEAIAYVSTHETMHFGYAKALLKLLRS